MQLHSHIKAFATAAVLIAIAVVVGVASVFIVKKDDQVVEELAENVIEKELGLPSGSIDLTPNSKES